MERLPSTTQIMLIGYKHVLGLVSDFRTAFHHHYFAFLKENLARYHRHPRGSLPFQPHSGDVVLIKDLTALRGAWPLGVVTQVDKRAGKAFFKTVVHLSSLNQPAGPEIRIKEFTCNRLFPLELAASSEDPLSSTSPVVPTPRRF
jgi:hypothetical protein